MRTSRTQNLLGAAFIGQFLQSFKDFPPPAKAGPGGLEKALEMIEAGAKGGGK